MSQTQIHGSTQIQANTVTSGQVDSSIIVAGGGNAFTGDQSMGSHKLTNVGTPTSSTDAANKTYVDTAVQGLSSKYSAVAGTNTETLTISSGTVTQITGTTVNGVSPNVNDYIVIMNAPASTGAAGGTTLSTQPANGLYQVTSNTTNLSVSRAADMSGSNGPWGAYVFVAGGSQWGGGGFVVTTPSTSAAFTYGTNNIKFTQFTGAGEITSDGTLTISGNQITRAALTGDVTATTGSNATTIAAAAVSLAKMANLAAHSVIGNTTGSSATPTAVSTTTAGAASSVVMTDGNANITANAYVEAVTTTATSGATTTLTVSSTQFQQFTGTSSNQTVVLPNATTLANGQWYTITNRASSGVVTVQTNGGATFQTMQPGTQLRATLISNGSSAGTWDADYTTAGNAATVPGSGIVKSNGSVLQVATAGTDYMAPSDFVIREVPTGSLNGSNTTFTLANTPLSGTEMVFVNGILWRSGSGNDYTISGGTITALTAPATGDFMEVTYFK